jgi:predicted dehydrogenase/threonine dehydrogenase-like Zn-dependent dehydrogenase
MKQLIQNLSNGKVDVLDVPSPRVAPGGILVRTRASLVSAGTERMVATFAQANLLEKARSRPDLVRQTIEKAKRDGVLDTLDAVRNRLDQPMPLGYSAAGEVLEVGADVTELRVGDRVACAGAGIAVHAQLIVVPRNLAVVIPPEVSFEQAAFTTLGAIAMHGIRLADVQLGERVAVIGLGLLGLLGVQMLRAAGCVVIGNDPNGDRCDLAMRLGAQWAGGDTGEFAARVAGATGGHGADAVLITADTPSDQPVELAGEVARRRGAVISVGAVGTRLPRKSYFEKELQFRVSRSYGPGRYDAEYEQKGRDYPYEFVRWTENRNMRAFAELVAAGAVDPGALITHRFEIEDAARAYDLVTGESREPYLGIVLRYSSEPDVARRTTIADARPAAAPGEVALGVAGAGLFANAVLLPAIAATPGVKLIGIASGGGLSARRAAERFGFAYCASGAEELLRDETINTVAIVTRHRDHARLTEEALRAGKNVFVEKPLCLTHDELDAVVRAHQSLPRRPMLMVGFNRRFAPFVAAIRDAFRRVAGPVVVTCRVNAGALPPDHWLNDPEDGGGRLRGEGCHFIDLMIDLAGDRVRRVTARGDQDNFAVTLEFENGSLGMLAYVANGSREFGKELIEVFGGGVSARLDDYRTLQIAGGAKATRAKSRLRQDKGHRAEWAAIARHLSAGGPAPIPFEELVHSTRVTLAAYDSLRSGAPVEIKSA